MNMKLYTKDIKLNNLEVYLCYGYLYQESNKQIVGFWMNLVRYSDNKFQHPEGIEVTHYCELPEIPEDLEILLKN